jgi:hypothetical protein
VFRNDLNANFDDLDADINAQKARVDNLIASVPQPSEVVDARGGKAVLKDRLDAVDSSLAAKSPINIGKRIDPTMTTTQIQTLLDGKGIFYFVDGTYSIGALTIKSDTKIIGKNAVLSPNSSNVVMLTVANSSVNVDIEGLILDCNNQTNIGLKIGSYSKNVNVDKVTVKNVYADNTKPAYGIICSSLGCSNIKIDRCVIDTVNSVANGTIADSAGGWSKGVIVGFGGIFNSDIPSPMTESLMSQHIVISNNTISNITPQEDADGIYIEGYSQASSLTGQWDLDIVIERNLLINCAKRFIKVIPCGGVIIRNNKGYNYINDNYMHACISYYSGNTEIHNNEFFNKGNSHIRYGIEVGHDSSIYGQSTMKNIRIYDNLFDLGVANYTTGNLNYGICLNEWNTIYKNVIIERNEILGAYQPIVTRNSSDDTVYNIDTLIIKNNYVDANSDTISYLTLNRKVKNLIVIDNVFRGESGKESRSNPIVIDTNNLSNKFNNVIFSDNYFGYVGFSLQLRKITNLVMRNNTIYNYNSSGITTTDVTLYKKTNNYGLVSGTTYDT